MIRSYKSKTIKKQLFFYSPMPPIYRLYHFGKYTFSHVELFDILKAWLAVSLAFGIVLRHDDGIGGFLPSLLIAAVIVGTGFLLHEFGHKLVAQHYHFQAEFRSFDEMLFLAIIMSFFGFVFAAPGAVMIQTRTTDLRTLGKIAIAGPLVNILLALFFLLLHLPFGLTLSGTFTQTLLDYGLRINIWLALFNMIPFAMFDGAKVWKWNKYIWIAFVLFTLVLFFMYM